MTMSWVGLALGVAMAIAGAGAHAQDRVPRPFGNAAAMGAASELEMFVRRIHSMMGDCADIDPENSAAYILVVTEHLRDRMVGDTIVRTELVATTELVRAGVSPDLATARVQREAVMRRQLDLWHREFIAGIRADVAGFTRHCRSALEDFARRRGVFRPLATQYPAQMRLIADWR
jgi:hypothetical protein